jgi:hypothetical protein
VGSVVVAGYKADEGAVRVCHTKLGGLRNLFGHVSGAFRGLYLSLTLSCISRLVMCMALARYW